MPADSPPESLMETSPFNDDVGLLGGDAQKRYKVHYPEESDTQAVIQDIKSWFSHSKDSWASNKRNRSYYGWAAYFLPCLRWLYGYNLRENLLMDFLAGTSVAALVVPQGMSYAKSAGLPSVYGLYGAFVPVLVYAGLGSSRHLAVGPVAVTSLLLGNGLPDAISAPVQLDPNNPKNAYAQQQYNMAAIQVAFLVGIMYTLVGVLRLGWLTNFISTSVIAGFMSGAAITIGLSQVKFLFGYNTRPNPANTDFLTLPAITFPRHTLLQQQLGDLFGSTWTPYFQWREFIMGISWIAIMLFMKWLGGKHKRLVVVRAMGPLTVCILSIAISNIWNLKSPPHNIRVVGTIPKGLPSASWGWFFPMDMFGEKFKLAIVVCIIDVLESISIAKALAYKNRYQLNATMELRALGIANIIGSCFHCYTNTGSFSRSAVMDVVGAKTQLAGFVGAIWVMIVLLCLTPVFKNMPNNAQGAIIIAAVIGLVKYEEWWYLLKVNKFDFLVFNAALFGVLFAGVDIGLGIAIGVSVVIVLWKTAFPKTAQLGRLPGTTVYRNVKQYPEAEQIDGLLLLRIDAPLYFANVNPMRDAIQRYERQALQRAQISGTPIRYIIIDLSPVTDIDASASHFINDWIRENNARGTQLVFANPSRLVTRSLENAGIPDKIGRDFIRVRMHDAVAMCTALMKDDAAHDKVLGKDFGAIGVNEPAKSSRNLNTHTFQRNSPHPTLDNYEGGGLTHV